jgi:hypothetical protein
VHAPATSCRLMGLDPRQRFPFPPLLAAGSNSGQLSRGLGDSTRRQLHAHADCISILDSSRLFAWSLFHYQDNGTWLWRTCWRAGVSSRRGAADTVESGRHSDRAVVHSSVAFEHREPSGFMGRNPRHSLNFSGVGVPFSAQPSLFPIGNRCCSLPEPLWLQGFSIR